MVVYQQLHVSAPYGGHRHVVHTKADDGHHGRPKHVVVARLPSLAIKIQYSGVYGCFFTLIFYIVI
jgi:hypothetical protein